MARQPKPDASTRDPKPDDIQAGQTQFLIYQNAPIRGTCHTQGHVKVSWATGFSYNISSDHWNEREFLEHPERTQLVQVGMDEFPSMHAFFHKIEMERQKTLRVIESDRAKARARMK